MNTKTVHHHRSALLRPIRFAFWVAAVILVFPLSRSQAGDSLWEAGAYSPIIAGECWVEKNQPTEGAQFRDAWNYRLNRFGYQYLENHDGLDVVDGAFMAGGDQYGGDWGVYGVDRFDVVFFNGHGAWNPVNPVKGTMFLAGNPYYTATFDCRPWTSQMSFGNGGGNQELKAMIAHSCNSLEYEVWEAHGMDSVRGGSTFNIWNGWHGGMNWGSTMLADFKTFLKNVKYDGLGLKWVTVMSNLWGGAGGDNDECATTLLFGANDSEISNVFYYSGLKDFRPSGWWGISKVAAMIGCDPHESSVLLQ